MFRCWRCPSRVNKRECSRIARSIADHTSEFRAHDNILYQPPVGYVLRGCILSGTSDKDEFRAAPFALPLYAATNVVFLSLAPIPHRPWPTWSQRDQNAQASVLAYLKEGLLPFVSRFQSPNDVIANADGRLASQDLGMLRIIGYSFAFVGDLQKADEHLTRLIGQASQFEGYQHEIESARSVLNAIRDGHAAVHDLLNTLTQRAIGSLKLEGLEGIVRIA